MHDVARGLPVDLATGRVLDRRSSRVPDRRWAAPPTSLDSGTERPGPEADAVLRVPIESSYLRAHTELARIRSAYVTSINGVLDEHPALRAHGYGLMFHPTLVGYICTSAKITRRSAVFSYPDVDGTETSLSFSLDGLYLPFYPPADRRKLEGVIAASEIDCRTSSLYHLGSVPAREDILSDDVLRAQFDPRQLEGIIRAHVIGPTGPPARA